MEGVRDMEQSVPDIMEEGCVGTAAARRLIHFIFTFCVHQWQLMSAHAL